MNQQPTGFNRSCISKKIIISVAYVHVSNVALVTSSVALYKIGVVRIPKNSVVLYRLVLL